MAEYLFSRLTVRVKSALDVSGSIMIGTISSTPTLTPEANIMVKDLNTLDPVPPIPNINNFDIVVRMVLVSN